MSWFGSSGCGARALWLPGTDHAGIATQNVVERILAAEGSTRFDVGRDAFVERVWAYVRETGAAILTQLAPSAARPTGLAPTSRSTRD